MTRFIRSAVDLYLLDVHSILGLPIPEAGITAACNFTCASALLNITSGLSTVLYDPSAGKGRRGEVYGLIEQFFRWDVEPRSAVCDGTEGAALLYDAFRNPLAHAFGRQNDGSVKRISRYRGAFARGFGAADDLRRAKADVPLSRWIPGPPWEASASSGY